jgi:4-amino-4-deoxy-L-arabinose transferase-like glycosyltransferase
MPLFIYSKRVFQTRQVQALLLFFLFSAPVLLTLPDYGVSYDEPIYLEASRSIRHWLSLDLQDMLSRSSIEAHWKTDPVRNVHPSGVKWLYLIAQATVFWEKDPYIQNRLFFVLVFAASLVLFLQWNFGPSLAKCTLAVLLLLSIPRFFAHAHFAATDMPMTAFLMLFAMATKESLDHSKSWLAGILLGILASIKITSLLLALPVLLLFLILHRNRWTAALRRASVLCGTAALSFYALNPDWWYSPFSRAIEFINQTVSRRDWTPFTVYFQGHLYGYRGPFYYPFVMFFITTPLLHLLLLLAGFEFIFRDKRLRADFRTILLLIGFFTPFLILALPLSPTNDGIRYLLPAFPFAVCLMTLGLLRLWDFVARSAAISASKVAMRVGLAAGSLALLALDLHNPARRPPYELSYYNSSVGGLAGAFRRGYETTYWWEIFSEDAMHQVNKHTAGKAVYFPLLPTDLFFEHAMGEGKLAFSVVEDLREAEFVLIIGRPNVQFWENHILSALKKEGKTLSPVWEISVDSVPLLRLHKIQQIVR